MTGSCCKIATKGKAPVYRGPEKLGHCFCAIPIVPECANDYTQCCREAYTQSFSLSTAGILDQPPHCGLLFAGTHELEAIFTRQALELEQWRSRFHAGQALPGISEEEAADIVHSELGLGLSQRKIHKLISKSRITDLRNGGQHTYVSARRLFWVIRELQAVANEESTHARHQ